MVNELRSLLHESSDNAPYDDFDASSVLRSGRSRIRRHRTTVVAVAGLAAAGVVAVSTFALNLDPKADPARPTGPVSEPVGPVLTLDDSTSADLTPVYRSVNEGLDPTTARFLDGVTEDGQAIVSDATSRFDRSKLMLVDLATGAEHPLPDIPGQVYSVLQGSADRIVYNADKTSTDMQSGARTTEARTLVLDRTNETWREMRWPALPEGTMLGRDVGPDGRMYVAVNTDVDALTSINTDGLTGDLWSVSLTDPTDVRDEDLVVGAFAIDGDHLVWSERSNGISNRLTVRDLETGEDTSFDPQSGAHCIQYHLGVDDDRIVLSQECVTQDGVPDDRVQVVSMTGEPEVTIQDASIQGYADGGGHLLIASARTGASGVYSYHLTTGDFVRLSTSTAPSGYDRHGPVIDGYLLWSEAYQQGAGTLQKIARVP